MTVDIFIRTYKNDLQWLAYCLSSIHKHLRGFRKIIISIPKDQTHHLIQFNLTQETVVTEELFEDDYLGQQISKIFAFEHSDADYIMFLDSDCVIKHTCNVQDFFSDGRPILLKTKYEKVGDAICWKEITEKFVGFKVDFEYMRRLPVVYHRNSLVGLVDMFPNIKKYILNCDHRSFSEFNAIGAYIENFESERYEIVDTDDEIPYSPVRQFWSWGGITSEVKQEIEQYLK
jgi:glycosyltransferase involved in cell wall biosynthesis